MKRIFLAFVILSVCSTPAHALFIEPQVLDYAYGGGPTRAGWYPGDNNVDDVTFLMMQGEGPAWMFELDQEYTFGSFELWAGLMDNNSHEIESQTQLMQLYSGTRQFRDETVGEHNVPLNSLFSQSYLMVEAEGAVTSEGGYIADWHGVNHTQTLGAGTYWLGVGEGNNTIFKPRVRLGVDDPIVTPEPASIFMFGMGLLGFLKRRFIG